MSNYTDFDIAAARDAFAEQYGSPVIPKRANLTLSYGARNAGEHLAVTCGLPYTRAEILSALELATFYAVVTSGGPDAGRRMARRLMPTTAPVAPTTAPVAVDPQAIKDAAALAVHDIANSVVAELTAATGEAIDAFAASLPASIKAEVERIVPRPVAITVGELPTVTFEVVHPRFELLLEYLTDREHVWLCGPRGSGKSIAAVQAAEALGLTCHIMTGAEDATDLLGYIQPHNGEVKETPFRLAWINGGAILFDEMDTYNPAAIIVMNDALANKHCTFPDGAYKAHPNFVAIAGTNTNGDGAQGIYSARSVIDGSTKDRFAFLHWNYCEEMETRLGSRNPAWTRYVQAVRAYMVSESMDGFPSPRASIKGANDIARGRSWAVAQETRVWKGLAPEYIARIERAVPVRDFERDCPFTLV